MTNTKPLSPAETTEPADASLCQIQIFGANLPSGEPVVVLSVGEVATVLTLALAIEVGQALFETVAKSDCAEIAIPTITKEVTHD